MRIPLGFWRASFVLTALALTGAIARPASAQRLPKLDPATYVSPTGAYRLLVDPGTEYGQGPARYRLTRGGDVVWEGDRSFTCWQAAVGDDGVVAGYAYSNGLAGFPMEKQRDSTKEEDWTGDFRVVLLAADGTTRFEEITRRTHSRIIHALPIPQAKGLFLDPANERLVVRMADDDLNQRVSTWRVYRLSDGKRLADQMPRKQLRDAPQFCDDFDARPVAGTQLTLVHWWLFGEEPGGKFTLLLPDGRVTWTLNLPGDYSVPDNQQAEWKLRDDIEKRGAILSTDQRTQFDLWHVRDRQRVTYRVRPRDGKPGEWDAVEIGRTPFEPGKVKPAEHPEVTLEPLGSYSLAEQGPPRSPIRSVRQFGFDGTGRIGFIRKDLDGTATFVRTGADDASIVEVPMEPSAGRKRSAWHAAWLKDDQWIVIGISSEALPEHRAYRIDAARRTSVEFPLRDCPDRIEKLVSDRRGGFVVLVEGEFTEDGVIAFDQDGRRRWRVGRKHSGGDILMSPEDIAVATDGRVAVVSSFHELVQVFDSDGKHARRIELKSAFKREPVYPSELAADADGGFIVGDWQGAPPIFRITSRGRFVASLAPRYADGRAFSLHYGVQAAPDGRLWTTDGESFLRLDEKGIVDRVVGDAPNPDALGESSFMTMDQRGFAYLVSNRTKAVHVFDSAGTFRHVCAPLPGDATTEFQLLSVAVDAGGEVFLSTAGGYLRFSNEGKRLGIVDADPPLGKDLQIRPDGQRWHAAYKFIFLSASDGELLKTIDRRPDHGWFGAVSRLAASPSGALAAISTDAAVSLGNPRLNIFAQDGAPVATFPLPEECRFADIAFSGTRAIVAHNDRWLVIDVARGETRRFAPAIPPGATANWRCFVTDSGRTLALCEPNRRVVHRFRLPTE